MTDGKIDAMAPSPDDVACGLVRTDNKGRILWVNQFFCLWLGFEPEQLVGKKKLQDLMTIGGRIFHQTHWQPLLQQQNSVAEIKLDFEAANGAIVPMLANALRRERDGQTIHDVAFFVARDRHKYEQELLNTRTKLQALIAEATRLEALANDRAAFAEQMIGIVSHDLRNPFVGNPYWSSRARADKSERTAEAHERPRRSVHQSCEQVVADLLDFTTARIGVGIPVAPRAGDLDATVAEAVAELGPSYPEREVWASTSFRKLPKRTADRCESYPLESRVRNS